MTWNPHSPGTIGNEWRVWRSGISADGVVSCYLNSSATETIDGLLMPYFLTGAPSSYGKLWAEVYNAADLGAGEAPSSTTFLPNEDVAVSNVYYFPVGGPEAGPINNGASNVDQYLDDQLGAEVVNVDYLRLPAVASARFAFGTSGLAAGRVLSVTFSVNYFEYGSFGAQAYHTQQFFVDLYNANTFVTRLMAIAPQNNPAIGPTERTAQVKLYINPLTGEPWSRDDIINMDTGTNLLVQIENSINANALVSSLRVVVEMISEKRLAIGGNTAKYTPPFGMVTDNFCSLRTPAGTDNWSKSSGTDYVVVMRRLPSVAPIALQSFNFRYADSGVFNPHDQAHSYPMSIDVATGRILSVVGLETKAFSLWLGTSGGAASADSQVYHTLVSADIGPTASKQPMSNASSTTYSIIRAVVGIYVQNPNSTIVNERGGAPTHPPIGLPDAPLLFKIKRTSDNVQMGGTATLNPADIFQHTLLGSYGAGIKQWYDVQLTMASPATLVSGTQYYIEFSAAVSNFPYYVMNFLDYTEFNALTGDQSYGGATDAGFYQGTGPFSMDWLVTATTAPPTAPATITVTKNTVALPDPGDPSCAPGSHEYAHVAWATTADGEFARYEVQRSEDGGVTWELVARVASQATLAFNDYEAARDVAVQYRVRMVRGDGTATAWRTETGMITMVHNTQSVVLATNSDAALTVGYLSMGVESDYTFLSDNEVAEVQMHNRDFQVQFRPLEDRGVGYTFTLLIHTKSNNSPDVLIPPGGRGAGAFAGLRAIVEDPASPYTTVFTPDGVRIFGSVRLPSGHRIEPAAYYVAVVTVVPVASASAVTDL